MKLNIGCGGYPLEGYHNIDSDPSSAADEVCDFWLMVIHLPELDEIRMDHFLEHLPFIDCHLALSLCRGCLREGGTLSVEVPDLEAITAAEITDPEWFRRAVFGAQPVETHLNGFTADLLRDDLLAAGFSDVSVTAFVSEHEQRAGLPCLRAEARG